MTALSLRGVLLRPSPALATASMSGASMSSEVRPRTLNTAGMKRGRGGRSSFSGDVVTVFGSNGFIGAGVANRLGKNGSQMILPYRGEHYKMMRMKTVGDLGQVLFCPFELGDEDAIRRAVAHSNIVINCIGRGFDTMNFTVEDVNITGPARIARICKEMGVERFVNFSHINARQNPEAAFLPGGSRFLRTKYQGELAVRAEFPEATIFRCADVYGQGDNFINFWFSMMRKTVKSGISLYGKGEMTIKQPLYRGDLLDAIMASLHNNAAIGETYEAVGPERMTQAELLTYMYALTSRTEEDLNFRIAELMIDPITFAKAFVAQTIKIGNVKVFHQTSLDRLERDSISDTSDLGLPDITSLGVKLSSVTEKMPWELAPLDAYAYYFYETPDEKKVVKPPKMLAMDEERAINARRAKGYAALIPGANMII